MLVDERLLLVGGRKRTRDRVLNVLDSLQFEKKHGTMLHTRSTLVTRFLTAPSEHARGCSSTAIRYKGP